MPLNLEDEDLLDMLDLTHRIAPFTDNHHWINIIR
jgi:hypothetical protein